VTALAVTARTLTTRRHARPGPADPPATAYEPYGRDRSADVADSAIWSLRARSVPPRSPFVSRGARSSR